MKLPYRFACLLTAALTAQSALAFELVHSEGSITLPTTPERIVSFDPAMSDTLVTLGVDIVGVPKSTYRDHMAALSDKPVVGTLFEPDYAAVQKLDPDLIISGRRSVPAMPELAKIAPTAVFHNDLLNFIDGFKRDNLAVGKAFGKEAEAQAALDKLDTKLETLHETNRGKTGAFLFVFKENVAPSVPGDRFGYVLEVAGLESVLPAIEPEAANAPRPAAGSPEAKAAAAKRVEQIETIAKAEPDWLIVLDRGAINDGEKTAAQTLAKHPVLGQTKAFQEGRVFYVDPQQLYIVSAGLTNINLMVDEMLAGMK